MIFLVCFISCWLFGCSAAAATTAAAADSTTTATARFLPNLTKTVYTAKWESRFSIFKTDTAPSRFSTKPAIFSTATTVATTARRGSIPTGILCAQIWNYAIIYCSIFLFISCLRAWPFRFCNLFSQNEFLMRFGNKPSRTSIFDRCDLHLIEIWNAEHLYACK